MKCLGVDYDGTLRRGESVSQRNKEAIQRWRESGNIFGIVSGRSLQSLLGELAKNEIEADFIITNNGGVLSNSKGGIESVEAFDINTVFELTNYIKGIDCVSYVLNNGDVRSKHVIKEDVIDEKYGNLEAMLSEQELLDEGIIAQIVIALENNDHNIEYADYINEHFQNRAIAFPNHQCVDIVPFHCSKAAGLAKVVSEYAIDEADVVVVGDHYNDISMLERFKGYTFEDSPLPIKDIAFALVEEVADAIDLTLKG